MSLEGKSIIEKLNLRNMSSDPIRVIGIDLGTTNSTVAEILVESSAKDQLKARCLDVCQPTLEGEYVHVLVPSIVALLDSQVYIGEGAKRLRGKASDPRFNLQRNREIFWEVKNEMGIRRTYAKAHEGYQSAKEISGRILSFLHQSAETNSPLPICRTVITVPASFQIPQREDTQAAARLAGLEVAGGDLLDEPLAAFIDFWIERDELATVFPPGKSGNLLVFDFGGGTCDTALFRVERLNDQNQLGISPLSVSRYYRLGGGDIDLAILYEVLLPQIIEQNNLSPNDLDYDVKKNQIEPAFLSTAEALKVGLCTETTRLRKLNPNDDIDQAEIVKKLPGLTTCLLKDGREIRLQSPSLSSSQFAAVLIPFHDTSFAFHRESEYRMTCSIYAPIDDALDRANLDSDAIDCCLLVGGSCLIPEVVTIIEEYFPKAKLLHYIHPDEMQTAVARGAAYQALSLALTGHGVLQPVCSTSISVRTSKGEIELIPRSSILPFPPAGEWAECAELRVPATIQADGHKLRIELIDDSDALVQQWIWELSRRTKPQEGLILQYRMDENQILHVRLDTERGSGQSGFTGLNENPIHNSVNPDDKRSQMLELEELLRTQRFSAEKQQEIVFEIAEIAQELGQYDKATHLYLQLLRKQGGRDLHLMNMLGLLAGYKHDHVAEESYLNEAAKLGSSAALFNLALSFSERGLLDKAGDAIDRAIALKSSGPYYVLKAQIAEKASNSRERSDSLQRAKKAFAALTSQSEWEMIWYEYAMTMEADQDALSSIETEKRRRKLHTEATPDGVLPDQNER